MQLATRRQSTCHSQCALLYFLVSPTALAVCASVVAKVDQKLPCKGGTCDKGPSKEEHCLLCFTKAHDVHGSLPNSCPQLAPCGSPRPWWVTRSTPTRCPPPVQCAVCSAPLPRCAAPPLHKLISTMQDDPLPQKQAWVLQLNMSTCSRFPHRGEHLERGHPVDLPDHGTLGTVPPSQAWQRTTTKSLADWHPRYLSAKWFMLTGSALVGSLCQ